VPALLLLNGLNLVVRASSVIRDGCANGLQRKALALAATTTVLIIRVRVSVNCGPIAITEDLRRV
jgi:hypothetical protein